MTKDGFVDVVEVLNSPLERLDRKSFIPVERAECPSYFSWVRMTTTGRVNSMLTRPLNICRPMGRQNPRSSVTQGRGTTLSLLTSPVLASLHTLVGAPVIWGGPRAHARAQVDA